MPNPVPKKGEQDEHRVLSAGCEAIGGLVVRHHAFHEPFLLHLPESAGEDPRRQPRVVAQDLPEFRELQERHVAQDEQGPLAPEPLHALSDRVGLVCQERVDFPLLLLSGPLSRHYPFGPWLGYILSNGYHFARPRERRRWHGRRPEGTRTGPD